MLFNKAFTLAEVLIAVAIVGIIAVLTIPNFAVDASGQAFNTKFKTTYNQIEQVLIQAEYVQKHSFVDVSSDEHLLVGAKYTLDSYMKSHFNGVSKSNRDDKQIAPAGEDGSGLKSQTYKLKNGAEMIFVGETLQTMNVTGCTNNKPCIVYIDVNGQKGPNQIVECTKNDPCIVDESIVNDLFPIEIKFSSVAPGSEAVEYILSK